MPKAPTSTLSGFGRLLNLEFLNRTEIMSTKRNLLPINLKVYSFKLANSKYVCTYIDIFSFC